MNGRSKHTLQASQTLGGGVASAERSRGARAARISTRAGRLSAVFLAIVLFALLLAAPALAAPPSHFGGPRGEGAGLFDEPLAIAVDQQSGDSYIADRANNRIDKFGPDGEFLLAWGWGVADGTTAAPQTCGPESSNHKCFAGLNGEGVGELSGTQGIAVDNDPASPAFGRVYVTEAQNHRVQAFSGTGEFQLMIGGEVDKTSHANLCTKADVEAGDQCSAGNPGAGAGEFEAFEGNTIGVGPTGAVFVGDSGRVQKFSPAGASEGQFALVGATTVHALAVEPESPGDIYLTAEGIPGAHKYDAGGAELGAPLQPTLETFSTFLATGPAGELFIYEKEAGTVHGFDAAGTQTSSFSEPGGFTGITHSEAAASLFILHAEFVHVVTPPTPGSPFVSSESTQASEVLPTAATLSATLNPEGGEETTYQFQYGTSATYGQSAPVLPGELTVGPFEDQSVLAPISGLSPSTTYHFRVLATNKAGKTTLGPDQSFETLPPTSILSTSASAITATGATLEAELNPHGQATTFHFEYGLTAAYGQSVPLAEASAGAGNEATRVAAIVQGLAGGTTYHYRVVAANILGPSAGPDREFTTQGSLESLLPDDRGWELVSPPDKKGIPLEALAEEGSAIQAAADGNGLSYVALGPIEADPAGNRSVAYNQLLAHRAGGGGWSSQNLTTANESVSSIFVGRRSEYQLFSNDLSRAVVSPEGATLLSPAASEHTPYMREPDGEYVPLVTGCPAVPQPCPAAVAARANVPPGTQFGQKETEKGTHDDATGVSFVEGTADLDHLILTAPQALTQPAFETNELLSLYEWNERALTLVSQIPQGTATSCAGAACVPAASDGDEARLGRDGSDTQGALSTTGDRVVFETLNGGAHALFLRDVAADGTVRLDAPAPGAVGGSGSPVYQGASNEGSKIFFSDTSRLTTDSTAAVEKPDLYMCEIGEVAGHLTCSLSDLTVDSNPGEHADVQGNVLGVGGDGRFVYFVANGALAPGAGAGACKGLPPSESSPERTCNLYGYDTISHAGEFVAALSESDSPDWGISPAVGENLGNQTARVSPDGRWLTFMSRRSLTGYDNRDAHGGEPDEEVFLFHQSSLSGEPGALRCASCNPTDARPIGLQEKNGGKPPTPLVDRSSVWALQDLAASIPAWTKSRLLSARYQSHFLSNSGRLFMTAADQLVPQDTNGLMDVYEYEPPSVGSCTESSPSFGARSGGCVNLISSGSSNEESAFLDATEDGDDVFFLTRARLTPHDTDGALDIYDARVGGGEAETVGPVECSGDACQQPAVPPDDASPGSLSFNGAGNVLQCPKGKVKQKGKCVKKRQTKKKSKKHKHKKSKAKKGKSNKNRRAAGHKHGGQK